MRLFLSNPHNTNEDYKQQLKQWKLSTYLCLSRFNCGYFDFYTTTSKNKYLLVIPLHLVCLRHSHITLSCWSFWPCYSFWHDFQQKHFILFNHLKYSVFSLTLSLIQRLYILYTLETKTAIKSSYIDFFCFFLN